MTDAAEIKAEYNGMKLTQADVDMFAGFRRHVPAFCPGDLMTKALFVAVHANLTNAPIETVSIKSVDPDGEIFQVFDVAYRGRALYEKMKANPPGKCEEQLPHVLRIEAMLDAAQH